MLGLFGTLGMGQRSLQTQRQGIEVTGHNLANVNQTGYSRQRLVVQSSTTTPSSLGPQGDGVDAVAIEQLRNTLLDRQIQNETSVHGSLEARQEALELAQTNLGLLIDRQASGSSASQGASGLTGATSLAEGLSDLFASFQSLSTQPASSDARQALMQDAETLADRFNQATQRLNELQTSLNDSVTSDTQSANTLLSDIARLNRQIFQDSAGASSAANDLMDTRQAKLEELSKLIKVDVVKEDNGSLTLSVGGTTLVSNDTVVEGLETYDMGSGNLGLRTASTDTAITPTGGRLQGTIETRDTDLANLRSDLNTLAGTLITQVNTLHATGYNLAGGNGAAFFEGTDAGTIKVNSALVNDPSLIQASGTSGIRGDNTVVLALATLATTPQASLNNQTFSGFFTQTASKLTSSLANANDELEDQEALEKLLTNQRDELSGVSIDEEMTNLVKYQKAFEASAKLITTVDELLDTVIGLKR